MRAKYVGDPCFQRLGDGPDVLQAFGVTWEKGKPRDVPDGMEDAVRSNSHFAEVEEPKEEPKAEPKAPAKAEAKPKRKRAPRRAKNKH